MPEVTAPGVDLVVGVLSHNDAHTVESTAHAIRTGVAGLGGVSHQIVWADCGSSDDTPLRMRAALAGAAWLEVAIQPTTADLLERPYHGIPGKARGLRGILDAARKIETRACIVVDAGAPAVALSWVARLAGPVLSEDVDFVSPRYLRAPHEGALTKGLVYPFVRALYGARLRQPAAAEFACSVRFLEGLLEEDLWEGETAQVGIDLSVTTSAASGDFRLAEVVLGDRHQPSQDDGTPDLVATVRQVVGALFADAEARADHWQRVRGSVPVRTFGDLPAAAAAPRSTVDVERLIESYRLGYRELRDVWTWVLPPRTIVELRRHLDGQPSAFRLDDELWARVVYDFALAYRLRVLPRDHLLGSLVPLYLGWLASFVIQIREGGPEAADARIESLAAVFEAQKPYLIAKWRWPERLRS